MAIQLHCPHDAGGLFVDSRRHLCTAKGQGTGGEEQSQSRAGAKKSLRLQAGSAHSPSKLGPKHQYTVPSHPTFALKRQELESPRKLKSWTRPSNLKLGAQSTACPSPGSSGPGRRIRLYSVGLRLWLTSTVLFSEFRLFRVHKNSGLARETDATSRRSVRCNHAAHTRCTPCVT
jgi:hypothetical protein